ncbi:rhox homeobox family member 2B [Ochotona princeps]|uniref:rhox homeobox family member 2B n=1 Tax=Ochotona princeps TaxID=9978 RepID=UPI0027148DDE|nr:rhox homeobox family member 2B [Ochotona princeps]
MEPSDQYPKSFVTTMPGLGDDEDQEELCDMRLAGISFILDEGDTEDYVAFQQEHVANEGEEGEERRGGCQDGSIAPGPPVAIYPEGGSLSGGGHFLDQQLRELFAAAAYSPPAANRREENAGHTTLTLAHPRRTTLTPAQPGRSTVTPAQPGRTTLTPAQLQELESIFQNHRYLNKAARLELARRMDVTEAKLQVWFKNRRARWRRRQRTFRTRNQLPEVQDNPVNTTATESNYTVRAWDQNCPSVTPSRMSLWQPRLPQVSMSESMLMPEPQPMPPSVPRRMPSSVPYRMPPSVPQPMPLPVPHRMPPSVPHRMPLSVSQPMPLSVPQSMPPSVPHCMPLCVPQPTPPSVPQNMAPSVPLPMLPLVPMLVPVLMSEPQPMPLSVPQPMLTLVPMLVPVMMPEPQAMPLSVPPLMLTLVPMSVHMLVPEPQPMQLPVPPLILPPVPQPMLPLAPPPMLPPVPPPYPLLFSPPPLLYVTPVTHFIQDLCGRIWLFVPVCCFENNFN